MVQVGDIMGRAARLGGTCGVGFVVVRSPLERAVMAEKKRGGFPL